MKITLKGHANIRHYLPESKELYEMEVDEGDSVRIILNRLKIPDTEVMLVIIGDKIVSKDVVPQKNDCVELFPILAGG
jgi:sulfur carrier protein ThiS